MGRLACLHSVAKCDSIKPKFLFEPGEVDFGKKVITTPDKAFPKGLEIKLSNLSAEPMEWEADCTWLKKEPVFSMSESRGVLQANEQRTIKMTFNPYKVGSYGCDLPLYITDGEIGRAKYMVVKVRGLAAEPRLLFDRREVIIPVSPLGIESKAVFRVINDGYENLTLKYEIIEELGNLQVELRFPEGRTIGITKNRARVEVVFKHAKPISFTTKL